MPPAARRHLAPAPEALRQPTRRRNPSHIATEPHSYPTAHIKDRLHRSHRGLFETMAIFNYNITTLENLVAAQSFTEQSDALCALKNDTIGHVMKKEKWVEVGVLRPIVRVLLPERPPNWNSAASHSRGNGNSQQTHAVSPPDELGDEDLAHLQALELLGIFANGGPSFLPPLSAAGALPAIINYIDPSRNHPRLVYAALRTLLNFVETSHLVSVSPLSPSSVSLSSLADSIFASANISAFCNIIVAESRESWSETITNTAITIISELCSVDVRHQVALANAGILGALATKIASYVVRRGQVVPGAEQVAEKEGLRDAIPGPASDQLDIAGVFTAATAIIGDSRLRAYMLLSAPSILAVFPHLELENPCSDLGAAWKAINAEGLGGLDNSSMGAFDYFLPALPTQQQHSPLQGRAPYNSIFGRSGSSRPGNSSSRQQRSAHQPSRTAGASGAAHNASFSGSGSSAASTDGVSDDSESPMIPWLMDLVRHSTGRERLTAASVLTSVFKAGFATKPSRESAMAVLIVPLLIRMLHPVKDDDDDGPEMIKKQMILETAVNVFARLVANSEVLQKAAADGKAIQLLVRLLKESYERVSILTDPRPWNPAPNSSASPTRTSTPVASVWNAADGAGGAETADGPSNNYGFDHPYMVQVSSLLGPKGQSRLLAHRIRLREAVLKALTSLIAIKYDYQRLFVHEDVMMYVVASLNPTPSKPRNAPITSNNGAGAARFDLTAAYVGRGGALSCDPEYGRNPAGVLVAACNCVRMLARSIAILRTTLEDADISTPIYQLIMHPNVHVQIAATAAVCNLVTETSPMRDRFINSGIMDLLCTKAKSHNSELRLNAMWALKHLVDGVSPSLKKTCLEQLGSGWLLRLIDYDSESDSAASSMYEGSGRFREMSGTLVTQPGADEDVEMDQSGGNEQSEANGNGPATSSVTAGKMPWTAASAMFAEPTSGNASSNASATSLHRARFPQTIHERSRTGRLRQAEIKLEKLRDMEQNTQRKSIYDDMLIQEQGLHFIRNLIGPGSVLPVPSPPANTEAQRRAASAEAVPGAPSVADPPAAATASESPGEPHSQDRDMTGDATDMIDHLFNDFGQDQFFAVLMRKLQPRPRPLRGSPAANAASREASRDLGRLQPASAKMVEAVVYILVHIAAGAVQYRRIVVAQSELMLTLVSSHCDNPDRNVRLAMCHLICNLTWRDSATDTDTLDAVQRTKQLLKMGVEHQIYKLLKDEEMDIREQAKMAADQLGLSFVT